MPCPILHGDIKGANIVVSDGGTAQLCDFGLSRADTATTHIGLKGSASDHWKAEELYEPGACKSLATDVWAFGMTMAEVSVDNPRATSWPFMNLPQVLKAELPWGSLATETSIFPSIFRGQRPQMPENLGEAETKAWLVAERCWTTDPADRPSMAEVLNRLLGIKGEY